MNPGARPCMCTGLWPPATDGPEIGWLACCMRHVSIAQLLISNGADKDSPEEDARVIRNMIFDNAPTFCH
jgi:hypothetical protein